VLQALVLAGSALACSCAPAAPAESLLRSDAAIVGRLLAVDPHGPARAEYRYEVLRVYRGRKAIAPASVLKVLSSRGSAACGLPDRVGSHFGLFLVRDRRGWAGSLCGVVLPRRLRAAAQRVRDRASHTAAASCAS
jgi:hypothetical protein